jgi:hypothetical protein
MFSNVRTHAIVAVCGDMAAEKTKLVKFASYFVAARYGGGAGGGVEEGLLPHPNVLESSQTFERTQSGWFLDIGR